MLQLTVAVLATIPVIATGIIAYQLQLEGQKLKGKLPFTHAPGHTEECFGWRTQRIKTLEERFHSITQQVIF